MPEKEQTYYFERRYAIRFTPLEAERLVACHGDECWSTPCERGV